jgi:hypothetical protein
MVPRVSAASRFITSGNSAGSRDEFSSGFLIYDIKSGMRGMK